MYRLTNKNNGWEVIEVDHVNPVQYNTDEWSIEEIVDTAPEAVVPEAVVPEQEANVVVEPIPTEVVAS
jgi:hypothetical protein